MLLTMTEIALDPARPPASTARTPDRVLGWLAILAAGGFRHDARMCGAEIGVWRATFSRAILSACPNLHLTMVDWWQPAPPESRSWQVHEPGARDPLKNRVGQLHHVRIRTDFADARRRIIHAESTRAALEIPDASLDWVFIDAGHVYECVIADLRAWTPKVRPGGIVGGHDLDHPLTCTGAEFFEIRRALEEFVGDKPTLLWKSADTTWGFRKEEA